MTVLNTLERGLTIIDLLIEVEADPVRRAKGLSIQSVSTQLDVHKSTASRLMQTLVQSGYATPVPGSSRGFRLGSAMHVYSSLTNSQSLFTVRARPFLIDLVEATGECAHAAVASGSTALVIEDVETTAPLRVVSGKGRRVPLHCTSAGKCLLAFDLAAIPSDLPARTARTITDPAALKKHLAAVAELGYALDDEENDAGVRCISAPVFAGVGGEPVGCIGIDGPTVRMDEQRVVTLTGQVIAAAAALTVTLGSEDTSEVGQAG